MGSSPFLPVLASLNAGSSALVSNEKTHRIWLVSLPHAKLTWSGSDATLGFWHAVAISLFTTATLAGHEGPGRNASSRPPISMAAAAPVHSALFRIRAPRVGSALRRPWSISILVRCRPEAGRPAVRPRRYPLADAGTVWTGCPKSCSASSSSSAGSAGPGAATRRIAASGERAAALPRGCPARPRCRCRDWRQSDSLLCRSVAVVSMSESQSSSSSLICSKYCSMVTASECASRPAGLWPVAGRPPDGRARPAPTREPGTAPQHALASRKPATKLLEHIYEHHERPRYEILTSFDVRAWLGAARRWCRAAPDRTMAWRGHRRARCVRAYLLRSQVALKFSPPLSAETESFWRPALSTMMISVSPAASPRADPLA